MQRNATTGLGFDLLRSLDDLGAVTPELAVLHDQLRVAELELARAAAIADAAALAAAGAFDLMGLSLADMMRIINDAFDAAISAPQAGATASSVSRGPSARGGGASEVDRLPAVLEQIARQTEDWLDTGLNPLDSQLAGLTDRFARLRDELLAAGGSIEDLVDLEAALRVARANAFEEAVLEPVRDFLERSERDNAGLKVEDRLGVLQSQFQAALANALADPSQESVGQTLGLAQQLQQFGSELFTGSALADFLAGIDAQVGGLLELELPEPEIPPVEDIRDQLREHLSPISGGVGAQTVVAESQLTALLEQNPMLAAMLGVSADQIPLLANMLGITTDQLIAILAQNPMLGDMLTLQGEQFPVLAEMLGVDTATLLELAAQNPMLADLITRQGASLPLLADLLGVSGAQLLELVSQNPLLAQLLATQGDALPLFADMLGLSVQQLTELTTSNPILGQIVAGLGDQLPLLTDMLGISSQQLLGFLEQNPLLAEQIATMIATGDLTRQGLEDVLGGVSEQNPLLEDLEGAILGPMIAAIDAQNPVLDALRAGIEIQGPLIRSIADAILGPLATEVRGTKSALESQGMVMAIQAALLGNISSNTTGSGGSTAALQSVAIGRLDTLISVVQGLSDASVANALSLERTMESLENRVNRLKTAVVSLEDAVEDNTQAQGSGGAGGT